MTALSINTKNDSTRKLFKDDQQRPRLPIAVVRLSCPWHCFACYKVLNSSRYQCYNLVVCSSVRLEISMLGKAERYQPVLQTALTNKRRTKSTRVKIIFDLCKLYTAAVKIKAFTDRNN